MTGTGPTAAETNRLLVTRAPITASASCCRLAYDSDISFSLRGPQDHPSATPAILHGPCQEKQMAEFPRCLNNVERELQSTLPISSIFRNFLARKYDLAPAAR